MNPAVGWLLLGVQISLSACDPFALVTTDKDLSVAQADVPSVELLTPERRLPPSAWNVRLHVLHFQDTILHVRFESSLSDARRFAIKMTGHSAGPPPDSWRAHQSLNWWPERPPAGSEYAEDMMYEGPQDVLPAIKVLVVPRGAAATVWVETFTV